MKLTVGQKILLGYGLAMLFMVLNGLTGYWGTERLLLTDYWVRHTYLVISEAKNVRALLVEFQNSRRGYIITGGASFQESSVDLVARLAESQRLIGWLTVDNPRQQSRLAVLGPLIDRRVADMMRVSDIRNQKGFADAVIAGREASSESEAHTAQIMSLLAEVENEERSLLEGRQRMARGDANNSHRVILFGSLLGFAVAAWVGLTTYRSIAGPLSEFQRFVTAVGEGDFTQKSAREGDDELGKLARGLNQMVLRLERSNRELQDFASVASHDLQEPLRKVQAFGDRLKTGYGEALDDRGRDYLDRMLNAAKRMQVLIQDLLQFARVTSQARPFSPVDLSRVAKEVLSDLEVRIGETNALVEVGDLPVIDADPMQIRQLLQNLIGNALKFHQEGKPPAVRVYAENRKGRDEADGMLRLVVKDEGIGFDEKYLDRIFTVFQRLHGRAEYEGTGVGLAICRKIAQRHGGDITAQSAPGHGASFLVALPVHHAALPLHHAALPLRPGAAGEKL
jgi:signal transduction histidine kinase